MTIEKAFEIRAAPHTIFAALERDVAAASAHAGDTHEVLRRDPGRALELRVTIGGVPCRLAYTLVPRNGQTEVVARLDPYGVKFAFFRVITLGMHAHGFEVALVEGLANLKAAVEEAFPEEDDRPALPPDE